MTKEIQLVSGPTASLRKLVGKHQRLLTEGDKVNTGEGINEVIADILEGVSGMSRSDITPKFAATILDPDRRKILLEARQFSVRDNHKIDFEFKWEGESERFAYNGVPIDPAGFKEHPLMRPTEATRHLPLHQWEWEPVRYESYAEVLAEGQHMQGTLADLGKVVRWWRLNGVMEATALKIPKKQRSVHTIIKQRRPNEVQQAGNGDDLLLGVNLDRLSYDDINDLYKAMLLSEGDLDTSLTIYHPNNGQSLEVDLLTLPAFFFPSGAVIRPATSTSLTGTESA